MSWIPLIGRSRERSVAGYRKGETLARALLDLGGRCFGERDGAQADLVTTDGALSFHVREKVHSQFMMHVVTLEFALRVPGAPAGTGMVNISHTGMLRRRALEFKVKRGAHGDFQPLLVTLSASSALSEALMALDFQSCQVHADARGYSICIEHYAASEVVSRMPALRRYIRLTQPQSGALLGALIALRALLQK